MTPKEKAIELLEKIKPMAGGYWGGSINKQYAKLLALIAIDEIIHYLEIVLGVDKEDFEYWQEVKTEIKKL
jgi:hypothetical protein